MKSIRIQNLKSIVDSGNIELNNMTVVIGKNSSGKSTLLRVFPLLKQSMTKRLSSPILWYGDYVDFGSFQKAITNGVNNDGVITFHFVIDDFCVFTEPDKYSYKDVELTLSLNDKDIVYYQFDISGYGKISFKLVDGLYKLFFNDAPNDNIVYVPSLSNSFFPVRKRNDSNEGIYRYLNYYPIDEEYLMLEENYPFSSYHVFKSNLELLFSNDK